MSQFAISMFIVQACIFVSFGIFLERSKVRKQELQKQQRRTEALYNQPTRICGEFVWYDGKHERAHHCVLDAGHTEDIHRSETGMGRKRKPEPSYAGAYEEFIEYCSNDAELTSSLFQKIGQPKPTWKSIFDGSGRLAYVFA